MISIIIHIVMILWSNNSHVFKTDIPEQDILYLPEPRIGSDAVPDILNSNIDECLIERENTINLAASFT